MKAGILQITKKNARLTKLLSQQLSAYIHVPDSHLTHSTAWLGKKLKYKAMNFSPDQGLVAEKTVLFFFFNRFPYVTSVLYDTMYYCR